MIHIINTKSINLPLYSGGLNEQNIKFAKEQLILESVRKHLDLVKTKKDYPKNERQDVHLSLDVVLMSREEYNNITIPNE